MWVLALIAVISSVLSVVCYSMAWRHSVMAAMQNLEEGQAGVHIMVDCVFVSDAS